MRRWHWIALGVLAVLGLTGMFIRSLMLVQGERLIDAMDFDQKLGAQVPLETVFKNEAGDDVQLASLMGERPAVLMLVFYTCRSTCRLEFEGALKSFKAMRKDDIGESFDVVTISIHPKETPALAKAKKEEILAQYGRPQSRDGWHFLTGDLDQIQAVAESVGFKFRYIEEKDQIIHPTGLVLLTPEGRVSRYFYGTEYPAIMLRDSIVAAADRQIGSPVQEILFGCFQYDMATGEIRVNVHNAIRVGGIATLSILLFSIFTMNRRSRSNPSQEDSA
jgi:protein SCO1